MSIEEKINLFFKDKNVLFLDTYKLDGKSYGRSLFETDWLRFVSEKPKIIMDIGSYDGGDSIRFIKEYPTSKVFSFEASPLRQDGLEEVSKKYGFTFIGKAISDKDGTCIFFDSLVDGERVDAQGSMFRHTNFYKEKYPRIKQKETFSEIPSIRIDKFCKDNNIKEIDLAHIDVEGAELKVITGFGDIRPKMVFIETLGDEMFFDGYKISDLHRLLLNMDYILAKDLKTDRLYIHKNFQND